MKTVGDGARAWGALALAMALSGASLGALAPDAAYAARGYRLSIAVAPDPDVSGDPLTIVGALSNRRGLPVTGVRLVLYHRVNPAPTFTPIQRTRTKAAGFYEIDRAEGVVVSTREWYIVAFAKDGRMLARSRVVRERVYAELTLSASASTAETGKPVTFTGTVSPPHAGARVILEREVGANGTSWRRIGAGRIGAGGSFTIAHRFLRPSEEGPATIRAVFPGDARNIRSFSEPVEISITQSQNPDLTLSPSAPTIVVGQQVTLTGKLLTPASGVPGGQLVTLYAHIHGRPYQALATATTSAEGDFSFTEAPLNNTAYEVKAGGRTSATVFEGVHDTISATASATSGKVGEAITVTGSVVPNQPGHVVYLQVRNSAGRYQTVQAAFVSATATYALRHQLRSAGSKTYRVYIPGGPYNLGAASAPFTVTVSPATALPMLEPSPLPEG